MVNSGIILASCALVWGLRADGFAIRVSSMSSASDSHYRSERLDKVGQPAPFATFTSSGSSIDAAFRDIGRMVTAAVGEGTKQQEGTRCAMAVVFFSGGECVDSPQDSQHNLVLQEDPARIEGALGRLHDSLPLVSDIIASPARATSVSHEQEQDVCPRDKPSAAVTATLALFHSPGLDVRPFVVHPARELGRHGRRLLQEDEIGSYVGESLERSACHRDDAWRGGGSVSYGLHRSVCLAFGGGMGDSGPRSGGGLCIANLRRLNGILGDAGRRAKGSLCNGASYCPLVSSVATTGPVFASVRDPVSKKRVTVAAGVVGAVLTSLPDSEASFHLVHAGDDVAIRGSQFRVASVRDGIIAEVVPVELKAPAATPSALEDMAGTRWGGGVSPWERPRWPCGVISAAEWCKEVVVSSTRFEKFAMQSALGVGILRRAGVRDEATHDRGAPAGVARNLPALGCLPVMKVNADGSISVAVDGGARDERRGERPGAPAKENCRLRAGDLCDIRAMGVVASLQATSDAYSWLRVARLSAMIEGTDVGGGEGSCRSARVPAFQGCLSVGSRARFSPGTEAESCEELVRVAAGHGSCQAVGMVGDTQLVSVDNVMMTCSSDVGMASLYVCGGVGENQ